MRTPALASRSRTFPCASRTTVPGIAPRDSGASSGAKRAYAVSDSDAKPMTMTTTRAEPRIGGKHVGRVVTRRQIADTASTTDPLGLCRRRLCRRGNERGVYPWTRRFARKEPDRVARFAFEHEVRKDLADHGGELEAVARACGRDDDVGMVRQAVDDEVGVRRVRVHADLGVAPLAVRERHPPANPRADALLVAGGHGAVDGIGIGFVAVMKPGDLHALPLEVGEAIEDAVRVLDDVDR